MRRFGLTRRIVHNGQLDPAALRAATKGQQRREKTPKAAKPGSEPGMDTAVPVSPLSPYELKFIEGYMAHSNATQAIYEADGNRERTPAAAGQAGAKLLKKAQISGEIERRKALAVERADVTAARIVQELAALGLSSMQNYVRPGPDGEPLIDFRDLTPAQWAAVREVTIEEFKDGRSDKREVRRVKFRLYDKTGPLELLGRHLQMFADKNAGAGGVAPGDVISLLLAAIDRDGRGMKTIPGTVVANSEPSNG